MIICTYQVLSIQLQRLVSPSLLFRCRWLMSMIRYYVNTAAPNPAPTWTHPLGDAPPPPAASTSPPPGVPQNPDKRTLPHGWISEYDPTHKAFYYVDTSSPNPAPSWEHPLGPDPGPSASAPAPAAPSTSPVPVFAEPTNPDTRALPAGWISQWDESHKAFFYVNTGAPNPAPTWEHPLGPVPVAAPYSPAPVAPTPPPVAAGPTNPDTRPLPDGWVSFYYITLTCLICVDFST